MKHTTKLFQHFNILMIISLSVFFYNCTSRNNVSINNNNLGKQTSLYLLQHAQNPVNWQPWNSDLYNTQNSDTKLLVISIGYSSCHWCHVMEKETFEDKEIASLMNKNFINIKVDKEENPDVDRIYMTAAQLMTGSGGWPLNVICLPDGRPVYSGTYHTKEQWAQVLLRIQKRYKENPAEFYVIAERISKGVKDSNIIEVSNSNKSFTKTFFEAPISNWLTNLDFEYGGELASQKFINPVKFNFLRQYESLSNDDSIRKYIQLSLSKIATSGIYDPIEGGVFRYTVDAKWEVPHFEKMLYDNAQFIEMFAEAYKQNPKPLYKDLIKETIQFINTRMRDQNGGFYASVDADNDLGEGRYYMFTKEEITAIAKNELSLFCDFYNVDFKRPIEENLYALKKTYTNIAFINKNNLKNPEWVLIKEEWDASIREIMGKRDFPNIDTKIITSWNALTIIGLTKASQALRNYGWLEDAEKLFNFITNQVYVNETLYHTYQNNSPKIEGFLEDYAFLAQAALELYSSTGNRYYLDWSNELMRTIISDFQDKNTPFFTFKKDNPLLSKIVEVNDGVMPSANAQVAHTLFNLGELLGEKKYVEKATTMLKGIRSYVETDLSSYSHWAGLMLKLSFPRFEVIICGANAEALTAELQQEHLVNVLIQQSSKKSNLPLLKNRFNENETLIYVCKNRVCYSPDKTVEAALIKTKKNNAEAFIFSNPF